MTGTSALVPALALALGLTTSHDTDYCKNESKPDPFVYTISGQVTDVMQSFVLYCRAVDKVDNGTVGQASKNVTIDKICSE